MGLLRLDYSNYHLVLVDDGSTDGTSEAVKGIMPDCTILRGNGRLWWGGALQKAYGWVRRSNLASDDYVLIMNDDTGFEKDFLTIGLALLRTRTNTLVAARGVNKDSRQPQDSAGYEWKWDTLECLETFDNDKINCLSTRGLLMRVGDFLDVGGFYPRLIPHYLSDLEFTMRAWEKGKRLITDETFSLYIDFTTTGVHSLENLPFVEFVQKYFSWRYTGNPLAWINFILLRGPRSYRWRHIKAILDNTYRQIFVYRFYPGVKRRFF